MTYFRYEPPIRRRRGRDGRREDLIRWLDLAAKFPRYSPSPPPTPRKFNTSRYFTREEFPTWEISTDQRLINNFGNLAKLSRRFTSTRSFHFTLSWYLYKNRVEMVIYLYSKLNNILKLIRIIWIKFPYYYIRRYLLFYLIIKWYFIE